MTNWSPDHHGPHVDGCIWPALTTCDVLGWRCTCVGQIVTRQISRVTDVVFNGCTGSTRWKSSRPIQVSAFVQPASVWAYAVIGEALCN